MDETQRLDQTGAMPSLGPTPPVRPSAMPVRREELLALMGDPVEEDWRPTVQLPTHDEADEAPLALDSEGHVEPQVESLADPTADHRKSKVDETAAVPSAVPGGGAHDETMIPPTPVLGSGDPAHGFHISPTQGRLSATPKGRPALAATVLVDSVSPHAEIARTAGGSTGQQTDGGHVVPSLVVVATPAVNPVVTSGVSPQSAASGAVPLVPPVGETVIPPTPSSSVPSHTRGPSIPVPPLPQPPAGAAPLPETVLVGTLQSGNPESAGVAPKGGVDTLVVDGGASPVLLGDGPELFGNPAGGGPGGVDLMLEQFREKQAARAAAITVRDDGRRSPSEATTHDGDVAEQHVDVVDTILEDDVARDENHSKPPMVAKTASIAPQPVSRRSSSESTETASSQSSSSASSSDDESSESEDETAKKRRGAAAKKTPQPKRSKAGINPDILDDEGDVTPVKQPANAGKPAAAAQQHASSRKDAAPAVRTPAPASRPTTGLAATLAAAAKSARKTVAQDAAPEDALPIKRTRGEQQAAAPPPAPEQEPARNTTKAKRSTSEPSPAAAAKAKPEPKKERKSAKQPQPKPANAASPKPKNAKGPPVPLQIGMAVQAKWGGGWYNGVVLALEEGGVLAHIQWDQNGTTELVMSKEVRLRPGATGFEGLVNQQASPTGGSAVRLVTAATAAANSAKRLKKDEVMVVGRRSSGSNLQAPEEPAPQQSRITRATQLVEMELVDVDALDDGVHDEVQDAPEAVALAEELDAAAADNDGDDAPGLPTPGLPPAFPVVTDEEEPDVPEVKPKKGSKKRGGNGFSAPEPTAAKGPLPNDRSQLLQQWHVLPIGNVDADVTSSLKAHGATVLTTVPNLLEAARQALGSSSGPQGGIELAALVPDSVTSSEELLSRLSGAARETTTAKLMAVLALGILPTPTSWAREVVKWAANSSSSSSSKLAENSFVGAARMPQPTVAFAASSGRPPSLQWAPTKPLPVPNRAWFNKVVLITDAPSSRNASEWWWADVTAAAGAKVFRSLVDLPADTAVSFIVVPPGGALDAMRDSRCSGAMLVDQSWARQEMLRVAWDVATGQGAARGGHHASPILASSAPHTPGQQRRHQLPSRAVSPSLINSPALAAPSRRMASQRMRTNPNTPHGNPLGGGSRFNSQHPQMSAFPEAPIEAGLLERVEANGFRYELHDDYYIRAEDDDADDAQLGRLVGFVEAEPRNGALPGTQANQPRAIMQLYGLDAIHLPRPERKGAPRQRLISLRLTDKSIVVPLERLDVETPLYVLEPEAVQHVYVLRGEDAARFEPPGAAAPLQEGEDTAKQLEFDHQNAAMPAAALPQVGLVSEPQPAPANPLEPAIPPSMSDATPRLSMFMWSSAGKRNEPTSSIHYTDCVLNHEEISCGSYVECIIPDGTACVCRVVDMVAVEPAAIDVDDGQPAMMAAKRRKNVFHVLPVTINRTDGMVLDAEVDGGIPLRVSVDDVLRKVPTRRSEAGEFVADPL